ncbi:MAG: TRIC cation channel family protein [Olsenella sp.]|nr:TRIC cation channel family protein [Olsenella sp.]
MLPSLISATGPDVTAVAIPAWLDASAVAVGSVSGILVARERKLDLVGYIVLAMVGGLGGGLIRDIIIQHNDVYMAKSSYAIPMTVLVGFLGFLFPNALKRFPHLLEWVDIVSVGLFVAAGTDKAIVYGFNAWAVVLLGTVTGVGGGMLRDIFLGDTPRIFQRSNFYALCAVAGALSYHILVFHLNVTSQWAAAICVAVVVLTRRVSLRFNILSPANVNLAPAVTRRVKVIYHMAKEDGVESSKRILQRLGKTGNYQVTFEKSDGPQDGAASAKAAAGDSDDQDGSPVIDRIIVEDDVDLNSHDDAPGSDSGQS